eukprot:15367022-Ditylum_brightwellii.AAC.1
MSSPSAQNSPRHHHFQQQGMVTTPHPENKTHQQYQQQRILFPIRDDKGKRTGEKGSASRPLNWVGLTPLEMAEKVASMVEEKMTLSDRRLLEPLRIDITDATTTTISAPKKPTSRASSKHFFSDPPPKQRKTSRSVKSHQIEEETEELLSPVKSSACGISGYKRERTPSSSLSTSEYVNGKHETSSVEATPSPSMSSSTFFASTTRVDHQSHHYQDNASSIVLSPWNPYHVIDKYSTSFSSQLNTSNKNIFAEYTSDLKQQQLLSLASALESSAYYKEYLTSYRRVRGEFEMGLQYIYHILMESSLHSSSSSSSLSLPARENNHDLEAFCLSLCNNTIQKMKTLTELASSSSYVEENDLPHHLLPTKAEFGVDCTSPRPTLPPKEKKFSKKEFANYMNHWLRSNWTNPYPDDEGLQEMASDCGTTTAVVSNWLINARTRKWRPAIVKAYKLNRPADYLKEDAIAIFDGRPVQEI